MKQLIQTLKRIDRKGYKAYNDIKGTHEFSDFQLHMDHVQADPFASPSRARVTLSRKALELGPEVEESDARRVAAIDFFALAMQQELHKQKGKPGIIIDGPGQEMIDRTAVKLSKDHLEVRLSIHLPARGRTIQGQEAIDRLTKQLPEAIQHAVQQYSRQKLTAQLELADQQQAVRRYLQDNDCIAFVANGSVLPRASGVSNRPMSGKEVISFQSPKEREVTIDLPHGGPVTGMAVPKGVTIIVGGGYHGKSTLLEAVERGVYNHRAGDGREFVIADPSAVKVRAEDGRSVTGVNISPFIANLPADKDTSFFTSENASGSTSQAANIMEGLEAGAGTLLIDEDTSATNFMIRDARMQALVAKRKEPITPFIDKVRALYDDEGISTILVVGGAGDYFDVADYVIMLEEYVPYDVTEEARRIASEHPTNRAKEAGEAFGALTGRRIAVHRFDARKGKKEKVSGKGRDTVMYGTETIDLSAVEQLITGSQTNAIAEAIRHASRQFQQPAPLPEVLDYIEQTIDSQSLDGLSPFKNQHPGDFARPRRFEIAAAINRYRPLRVER
ncbi:Predicted ATPase of the ABC class [Marinococcus luteus]|uniref:Predicted ATPase of the ABC class n=1 Tax=Marinococcus luteus TaxID=1122204 RepID=A0A1H2QEP5_9BACI|nr:ABC-ATPase domain-containing protein [Marinococcus luteus]SDW05602.1 Predicted ATPase of the ABC class [Marinococcus luteus]